MSEKNEDPQEDSIREAQQILTEIKQIKAQAEEQLKAAEVARKKADEDATYAYQAKVNSEEHAKATALFKGTAEADINSITTNKKNFEELVATATVGKAAVEADLKAISESRKAAEQQSNDVATVAQNAVNDQVKIDAVRAKIDTFLKDTEIARDAATSSSEKSKTANAEIEKLAAKAVEFLAQITGYNGSSSKSAAEITATLEKAKTDKESIASVFEHLKRSDEIATAHEARVLKLADELEGLNKQAEGLLPGAASEGLARSFNAQKGRFAEPQRRWLRTFVLCIIALVIVAAPSFIAAVFGLNLGGATAASWEEIFRSMAMRLPIVIPLVWLAIYAGRNYMLSLRLEEDYAYKEAISRAFEGYKREMKDIAAADATTPTPLNKLCISVLAAIAERPGRIYDGKQRDISLAAEAAELVRNVDELRKQQVASH